MPGRIGSYDTEREVIIDTLKKVVELDDLEEVKMWLRALINNYDKKA